MEQGGAALVNMPVGRWTGSAALGTGVAVLFAVSGCAGEPSEINWPEDSSPEEVAVVPPAPTLSPEELAAAEEILAVVDQYRGAEVAAFAAPPLPPAARDAFSEVLADPLLTEALVIINTMREGGVIFEGEPSWAPVVADLRLDEEPATATVEDCVDAASWRPVFAESGEPVPGEGRPDRFSARLGLTLYPDGWLIHDLELGEADWCVHG